MGNVCSYARANGSVIEFPTMADAEDAIRRLQGAEIQGVPVKLEISTVSAMTPAAAKA